MKFLHELRTHFYALYENVHENTLISLLCAVRIYILLYITHLQ